MNFWRAILASLLSLICTLSVSAFVILATLQTTLLDRQVVKTWLSDSGVYKNLISTTINNDPTVKEQLGGANGAIPADTVKAALNQTFSTQYVQQQTEKVIDSTYNWLDGKQSNISFSINTTEQKDSFVKNTAAALEPKIASLPACTSRAQFNPQDPTCIPPGTNAAELAQSLATDAGNQLSIFQEPLTDTSLARVNAESGQNNTPDTSLQQLPNLTANIRQWLLLLPIIAVLSGAFMVLVSRDRLKAAKHLAGRLTFGLGVTLVVGLLIAYFGGGVKLSGFVSANGAVISNIVEPIFHRAVPAIGTRLAWVSGISGLITLVLWIVLQTLWENREKAKLSVSPDDNVSAPISSQSTPPVSDTKSTAPAAKQKVDK